MSLFSAELQSKPVSAYSTSAFRKSNFVDRFIIWFWIEWEKYERIRAKLVNLLAIEIGELGSM